METLRTNQAKDQSRSFAHSRDEGRIGWERHPITVVSYSIRYSTWSAIGSF